MKAFAAPIGPIPRRGEDKAKKERNESLKTRNYSSRESGVGKLTIGNDRHPSG